MLPRSGTTRWDVSLTGVGKASDARHTTDGRRRHGPDGGRTHRDLRWHGDGRGHSDGLKRDAGFFGLLFTSEGSIIGSGWLFGALAVSTIGGPAAIIAWLIGSVAVILLALVHAELGGHVPGQRRHGPIPLLRLRRPGRRLVRVVLWLQAVGTAPIEVEAAIQYSSNYVHGLTHTVNGTVVLTGLGLPGGRRSHGLLHRDQPLRHPPAGAGQQRHHHVEGDHPHPHHRGAVLHPLRHGQLHQRTASPPTGCRACSRR